jgi:hypothetical protein
MVKKIYVNWELKRGENKYYVLDWSYEPLRGYDETEITEELIKTMVEINSENLDYLGLFETKEQLIKHLKNLSNEEDKTMKDFGNIEWDGPDHYVNWGVAGDAPVVCNALEALDTEYDIELQNGNWVIWLTGVTSDIYETVDLKAVLMDLLNCKIDSNCEQEIEREILDVLDRGIFKVATDENGNEESIISDDVNNFRIYNTDVTERVLKAASTLGRIDPAVLLGF